MAKGVLLFIGSLSLVLATACESRFVESSPDEVKIEGLPLTERIGVNALLDERLNKVQRGVERVRRILDLFHRVQKAGSDAQSYTMLDFLLDANQELKTQIPEIVAGPTPTEKKILRRATLTLPLAHLTPECQTVDTVLESSVIQDSNKPGFVLGDRLVYTWKICGSDSFTSAIEAELVNGTLSFRLLGRNNLESLIEFNRQAIDRHIENEVSKLKNQLMESAICEFKSDAKGVVEEAKCRNFDVKLSNRETALVQYMNFNVNGEIRFEYSALLMEGGKVKGKSSAQVDKDGRVDFDLSKSSEPVKAQN